jgi:hypothetical protein
MSDLTQLIKLRRSETMGYYEDQKLAPTRIKKTSLGNPIMTHNHEEYSKNFKNFMEHADAGAAHREMFSDPGKGPTDPIKRKTYKEHHENLSNWHMDKVQENRRKK